MEEKSYYFLYVWGCVDPHVNGPYASAEERDARMEEHREKEGRGDYDAYFAFDVTKGATVEF